MALLKSGPETRSQEHVRMLARRGPIVYYYYYSNIALYYCWN